MFLSAAITRYLRYLHNVKNASEYTLRNYDKALRLFTDVVGSEASLSDIDLAVIDDFRDKIFTLKSRRGTKISRNTQNLYLIPVRSFLKFCHQRDLCENLVAPEKIELVKPDPRDVSGLNAEELERLRQADTHKNQIIANRDRAIVELLFATGLRISELAALNREQINLQTREFTVIGKRKKIRPIFLTSRSAECLQAYFDLRTDNFPPVFLNARKRRDEFETNGESRRLSKPRSKIWSANVDE